MRVAFVGLGAMGLPMAINLVRAGHEVTGWNRSAARGEPLRQAGGTLADSPAAAASGAEVLVSMVADDDALADVLFNAGALEALPRGAAHVSCSTISVALSRRLAAAHAERGQSFVAAPVFGRPAVAEAGRLSVLAAGAAEARERCRPLLEAVGQAVYDMGDDPTAASVAKLAGNFLIGAMMEGLAEAFALGRRHGVEAAKLLEVVNGAIIKSPLYDTYGKLMAEEKFEPAGFKLRLGLKDARLALAAADAAAVPMPLASMVHDHLLAAHARGWGDRDWTAMSRIISEGAGL